ncbi:MAG: MerR family transcriptional regulator [Candidatus Altimarinota bacterium]
MKKYTVKQLAELSGVTVRTLHHYDEIGLLKPSSRTEAGYRLYEEKDLMRLQQILIYREMDFSLEDIKSLLDDPDYDVKEALHDQKRFLLQQHERYQQLLQTIDKTLRRLEEDDQLVTDEDLYGGFTPEQAERYDREAKEKYGDMYEISQKRVRQMTKGEWKAIGAEGVDITKSMVQYVGTDPARPEVQALIKRHHAWIEHFYPCSSQMYIGLSNLYIENPEFTAHYERFAPGLAHFISAAMKVYAEKMLK